MNKFLINSAAILAIGIIQVSFLTTWPPPVSSLNLVLCLVIFITVIINYQKGLWWALGLGLFLELFSDYFFGLIALSLLGTVIIINFLFNNFFTNRSLYSLLILGIIGTISHNLAVLVFSLIAITAGVEFNFSGFDFWLYFFWQPFLNFLILAVIFLAYYISTSRLKNIFLAHSNFYEAKNRR